MPPPTPDPYAEFGGAAVAPPTPPPSSDPYAEFGGAAIASAPAPAQQPQPVTGGGIHIDPNDPMQVRKGIEQTKGFVKGGMKTMAGLLDTAGSPALAAAFTHDIPGMIGAEPYHPVKKFTDWLRAHAEINNPDQETGNFVETAAEFLPFLGEGEGAAAEQYARKADLAKFAQKNPKLAALWNSAMINSARHIATTAGRAGVEQGTQIQVKTGDPEKAAEGVKTGMEWGAGLSTLGELVGGVGKAANKVSERIEAGRPGSRTVAGAKFEVNPKNSDLLLRNAKDVTQDPATQAVDEALGNIGRTAVTNSINRTNALRRGAEASPWSPPQRRLPGAAGFTVPTTPPEFVGEQPQTGTETVQNSTQTVPNPDYEAPAGELAPPVPGQTAEATAGQIGQPLTTATPEQSFTGPQRGDTRNATQRRIDAARGLVPDRMLTPPETIEQPVYQQRPTVTQPQRAVMTSPDRAVEMQPDPERLGGGGNLILTDDGRAMSPERARQQLAQYDRMLGDPDQVEQMGVRAHQGVQRAREDLAGQLGRYDNYAAQQNHFERPDPLALARSTDSLGDAATHLKAIHGQFWTAADKASGGEFSVLRDEEKRLEKQIYGANPTGRLDDLRQQLAENQQKQMDFFDKYKTTVSPHEWDTARSGYQDGIVLGNLNNMLQRKFGGITRADEAAGVGQRIFDPGNKRGFNQELEDFYNGGFRGAATNRQVLERTIGQGHMQDLKRIGVLFGDAERMGATQSLYKNIISTVSRHYHGVKGMIAAGAGATELAAHGMGKVAGLAGLPIMTGTIGGIQRTLTEKLINDPEFLKSFSYAITNKIPSRTAGPLLATRIIAAEKNQELQKKQPQPTGAK